MNWIMNWKIDSKNYVSEKFVKNKAFGIYNSWNSLCMGTKIETNIYFTNKNSNFIL